MEKKDTKTRQAEIVAMAIAIIGDMGVSGLTTARLAERLGMSEPNLYRHFKDKDAILSAIIDEIGRVIMDKAAEIAKMEHTPQEKLGMIMANHVAEVERRCGIPRLLFSEDMHVRHPLLREKLLGCMRDYLGVIEDMVAEGKADGTFRPDIDVKETARTFLGMVQFAAMRWSMGGLLFSLKDECERLFRNFCRMVACGCIYKNPEMICPNMKAQAEGTQQ